MIIPKIWLTINIKGNLIPLPLPIIFPLVLFLEILAIPVLIIYSIRKKELLPLKFISHFYLSRFLLSFMIYGRKFKVVVCDGEDKVAIGGKMRLNVS
ncbi:hypothetical protein GF312_10555 [Candidatus Poribacteria bacterium]|nr:hypothetical protein [Candidatus Poribacteria bacterium]